jgi:CHAD domain-containing protein
MSGGHAPRRDAGAAPGVLTTTAPAGTVDPVAGQIELLAPASFDLAAVVGGHAGVRPSAPLTSRPVATGEATVDATCFDSADLTLAAQGTTLKRYADGRWAVETSDGAEVVHAGVAEDEFAGDSSHDACRVPTAIRDRLHTQLRSRRLRAVARLVTTRTAMDVSSGPARVARVIHDDVTAHAADSARRYGRVVLVPTTHGPLGRAVLRVLTDACMTAGCTSAPRATELQLACGVLSPGGAVLQPAMPKRPRSATLTDLVAPMLGASVQRLLAHDVGVRLDTDPEDVHQLRVATRRLRADLRALRPALDRPRAAQLRAEASWLASLAGPVRDADVLLERIEGALATLPKVPDGDGARLLLRIAAQRRGQHEALLSAMRTERYDALLDALVEAVAHPPVRTRARARAGRRAAAVLRRATAGQWQALVDAVRRVGPSASAADLHQVRIAAKHARYTAEAAVPVLGKHAGRLAALATRAQTLLGDLHDAVVAQAWLQDAAGDAVLAGVADLLSAGERARAAALQAQWPSLWAKIEPKADRELRALTAQ